MVEQSSDKARLAREKRAQALRARRLAALQLQADRDRLNSFADELIGQAEALERSLAQHPSPTGAGGGAEVHQQVQQQQQQAGDAPEESDPGKDKP